MMWTFGPLTRYSWGWDLKLFGWYLVWGREIAERPARLYISDDATPPCDDNRGWVIW